MSYHYEKYIYARGFLLTTKKNDNLLDLKWNEIRKGEYFIYLHPYSKYAVAESQNNWVFFIGHCIDTINETTSLNRISQILLNKLTHNYEMFLDYLEVLAGRFAIFTHVNGETYIYNDATGMQSVFYHQNIISVASHAKLVAEATNSKNSSQINMDWLKESGTYHLPGNFTPYENVRFLLPNHRKNVNSTNFERYFPREDLTEKSIDEVGDMVISESQKQLKLLKEEYKLLFSLTGGLDSRTTLATMKNFVNSSIVFTYFYTHSRDQNYKGNNSLYKDRDIVNEITENIPLNHRFLPIDYANSQNSEFLKLREVLRDNTFLNHNSLLAKLYIDHFSNQNFLHIRSNIQGITKSNFRKKFQFKSKTASLSDIIKCTNPSLLDDDLAVSAFTKWLTEYNPNVKYNYDPFDLLYWESRMGTWHSQLILQSDLAFNTHTLINSHYILKNMLSLPRKQREDKQIYYHIIEKEWPVLLFWDINKDQDLIKVTKHQQSKIRKLNSGIKNFKITYHSGNTLNNSYVPIKHYKSKSSDVFYIKKEAPQKGDYATAEIPINIPGENQEYILNLEICSPYNKPKNSGRLKYQVFLNKELLLEEDIAKWGLTNQIFIPLDSNKSHQNLSIRILALRGCEEWNWGKAARVKIEKIEVVEKPDEMPNKLIFSSPFSTVDEENLKGIKKVISKLFNK
ncbi:hypothetical protein [Clostridium sp. 1xD42-85]|nr:hypothetical protein [Clostridium sp. 1xD42-85]NBJ68811.1 hypothetical protein [Roseburia sp. 1XD42-34]RKI80190.1 hypothetical protein D7V87_04880 [Clostridium sp. 1xD42-85]